MRVRSLAVALLLSLAVVAGYEGVRRNGFVYDDLHYLVENRAVHRGLSAAAIRWALTSFSQGNWHPLTWVSHLADVQLFGLDNPAAHHLVNLFFHAAATLALFAAITALTGAFWPGAAAAAIFALHPLHVEAVAWVAERKELLGALFGFLAIGAYAAFVRRRRLRWYVLLCLATAASLAAKPMFVTLPFVLLLLDWWPLGRVCPGPGAPGRIGAGLRLVAEKAPLMIMAAASAVVTIVAQTRVGAVSTLEALPLTLRLQNAPVAAALYLKKAVWPMDLAVFYPLREGGHPFGAVAGAVALLLLLSLGAWSARARAPYLLWGWFFFLLTLLPVIGIVQVGGQALADRYTYIPLTGPFIALTFSVGRWCDRVRPRAAVAAAALATVLALSLAGTRRQVELWRDGETLFLHAAQITERNWIAHAYLGKLYLDAGRLAEAQDQLERALAISRRFAIARNNLGIVLERQGRAVEAEAQYREVLNSAPEYAEAHNNLGLLLARRGAWQEAVLSYREALRLKPALTVANTNLAAALMALGRREEALRQFRIGMGQRP